MRKKGKILKTGMIMTGQLMSGWEFDTSNGAQRMTQDAEGNITHHAGHTIEELAEIRRNDLATRRAEARKAEKRELLIESKEKG